MSTYIVMATAHADYDSDSYPVAASQDQAAAQKMCEELQAINDRDVKLATEVRDAFTAWQHQAGPKPVHLNTVTLSPLNKAQRTALGPAGVQKHQLSMQAQAQADTTRWIAATNTWFQGFRYIYEALCIGNNVAPVPTTQDGKEWVVLQGAGVQKLHYDVVDVPTI